MRIHRHRQRKPKFDVKFKANEHIKAPEVRVIGGEGENFGVLATADAIALAKERGLDLIEVSPKAQPPVCRIMDFGNFKYQKVKEMKKQRAQSKEVEIKGVRLSLRIGENDRNIRLKQANKFLEKGNKVRVELILRGREKAHHDRAIEVIKNFVELVGETYDIRVEEEPKRVGGRIHSLISRQS